MAKRKKSVESFGSTIAVSSESASDTASAVKAAPPASAIGLRDSDEEESERAREYSRERVSARAYEIYQERGSSHGHDVEDWLEAERQIGGSSDRPIDD
jgi:hypothetical protein